MYHPWDFADGSDNSDDGIELQNITGSPARCSWPLTHEHWHLRGGVDFDFPGNVTIPANGIVLLVNFDPANAALNADFRSRFGVSDSVPLYGPFSGQLDNSSDTVRLLKPDNLEGTQAPYILVEEVEYQDEAPWPAVADGTGAALQRRVLNAYANDPTNWTAVAATAGAPSPGGTPPVITVQPASQTAIATLTTMLSVTATGSSPLGYQWKFNDEIIPGATSSVLNLVNLQTENAAAQRDCLQHGRSSREFECHGHCALACGDHTAPAECPHLRGARSVGGACADDQLQRDGRKQQHHSLSVAVQTTNLLTPTNIPGATNPS
jgi:hypothetical protein